MKQLGWVFAGLLSIAAVGAYASDDSGEFQGTGSYMSGDVFPEAPTQMALSVSVGDTSLTIHDCWVIVGSGRAQECYDSKYDLNENGEISNNGVKIGDVYPGQIVIFTGNGQRSEQMLFNFEKDTIAGSSAVRYQYTFSAFDGVSQIRRGQLSKAQSK